MTITNTVEIIRQQFPEYGDSQIIKELDLSQKIFADETKLGRKKIDSTSLTLLADGESVALIFDGYPGITFTVTVDVLGLLMDLSQMRISNIEELIFLDTDNVDLGEVLMWDYIDNILHFYNQTNAPLKTMPKAVKKIVIIGIIKPADIILLSSIFTIPEEFHYGVMADLLKRFWAVKGVLQNAAFWQAEYDRYRINAKRYANESKSRGKNYITISELGI